MSTYRQVNGQVALDRGLGEFVIGPRGGRSVGAGSGGLGAQRPQRQQALPPKFSFFRPARSGRAGVGVFQVGLQPGFAPEGEISEPVTAPPPPPPESAKTIKVRCSKLDPEVVQDPHNPQYVTHTYTTTAGSAQTDVLPASPSQNQLNNFCNGQGAGQGYTGAIVTKAPGTGAAGCGGWAFKRDGKCYCKYSETDTGEWECGAECCAFLALPETQSGSMAMVGCGVAAFLYGNNCVCKKDKDSPVLSPCDAKCCAFAQPQPEPRMEANGGFMGVGSRIFARNMRRGLFGRR